MKTSNGRWALLVGFPLVSFGVFGSGPYRPKKPESTTGRLRSRELYDNAQGTGYLVKKFEVAEKYQLKKVHG